MAYAVVAMFIGIPVHKVALWWSLLWSSKQWKNVAEFGLVHKARFAIV